MKIKKYIEKIGEKRNIEDMQKLGDMLGDLIYDLKDSHYEMYEKYKTCLYEMAYGKILNEDMAHEWVESMKPKHEHWTIEETTNAMNSLGYNCNAIEYYVVSNMIYNDYYNIVKDDEEMALKLAYMWLNDENAKKDKLYEYYKHIVKED